MHGFVMMSTTLLLWVRPIGLFILIVLSASFQLAHAYIGYEYALDTEYSGANFFDGWDFYTGNDPTNGFVTYYSRSSSQLAGLIQSSSNLPAYIGVDYTNKLPINSKGLADGAGRPSVRISSQRSWTHGLFIGDFNHAPNNICGTWPAFWTLGPNWPYTGEIDIMEGVNQGVPNIISLHTNETCFINSNSSTQTGLLSNTNCAYYPDYNVGCGVVDSRSTSYGDFNSIGGGVYAMQWTSEYIRVWFFPRDSIPQDINMKRPDPSTWGLPAANMMGNCSIDQHFQQHTIVFDNTFCGDYAGNPYVWNSSERSCAASTGYSTCDAYVANNPGVFQNAYWSINSVRVYQLVNPTSPETEPGYIASLQPSVPMVGTPTSVTPPLTPTVSLCPTYNFTTIKSGGLTYEIECDYDPPGPDIPPPYANYPIHSFEDCVAGCTYWNTVNGTNLCGAVAYDESIPFCYFKKYVNQVPNYRRGFAGARLIYYGYPQITDDPRSQVVVSTSSFSGIIPTPQLYRPLTTVSTTSSSHTPFTTNSVPYTTNIPPPLGEPTNGTASTTANVGTPTVSYSGSDLIPVANLTSKPQTESFPTSSTLSATTSTTDAPSSTTNPPSIAGFKYVGCINVVSSRNDFSLIESSPNMTIVRCISGCSGSYFAGLSGSECYCSNNPLSNSGSVQYSDSHCSTPCPGDPKESCGGSVPQNSSAAVDVIGKRQAITPSFGLLTLYFNTALQPTVAVPSTYTSTITLLPVSTPPPSSTRESNFASVSYDVTTTNTITVTAISTAWCDYCSTCPGFLTTLTTTITVPCAISHSAVTAGGSLDIAPPPIVPMMTTTRNCNACSIDNAASTLTLTVPCETAIAVLTRAASQVLAIGGGSGGGAGPWVAELPVPWNVGVAVTAVASGNVGVVATADGHVAVPMASVTFMAEPEPEQVQRSTSSVLQVSVAGSVGTGSSVVGNATAALNVTMPALTPLASLSTAAFTGQAIRHGSVVCRFGGVVLGGVVVLWTMF